jgi:hypothetical protein
MESVNWVIWLSIILMVIFCENGNELSDFIKFLAFTDYLSNSQLHESYSAQF